jgi:hypothetical protein
LLHKIKNDDKIISVAFKQLSKEVEMANKYIKKSSTSLVVKERQIKTTLIFHLTPGKLAIIRKTTTKTLRRMQR